MCIFIYIYIYIYMYLIYRYVCAVGVYNSRWRKRRTDTNWLYTYIVVIGCTDWLLLLLFVNIYFSLCRIAVAVQCTASAFTNTDTCTIILHNNIYYYGCRGARLYSVCRAVAAQTACRPRSTYLHACTYIYI